jgi:hypothetical protein
MSDSVLEGARRWLRESGYPLELRVGRILRSRGWNVQHACPFIDPREKKVRELDIFATRLYSKTPAIDAMDIALAVECKSSTKPWIVIGEPTDGTAVLHDAVVSDSVSRSVLFVAMGRQIALPKVLRIPDGAGHGLVRAHGKDATGDPTHPFAAVASVLSACAALGRSKSDRIVEFGPAIHWIATISPIIVLDGPLLRYSLDTHDEETLEQVEQAAVVVASPVDGELSIVRILTVTALEGFLDESLDDLDAFGNSMLAEAETVCQFERRRVDIASGRLTKDAGMSSPGHG